VHQKKKASNCKQNHRAVSTATSKYLVDQVNIDSIEIQNALSSREVKSSTRYLLAMSRTRTLQSWKKCRV